MKYKEEGWGWTLLIIVAFWVVPQAQEIWETVTNMGAGWTVLVGTVVAVSLIQLVKWGNRGG